MSRIDEPEHLKLWNRAIAALGEKPKCCHTCDNYSVDGVCNAVGSKPPDDFVLNQSKTCQDFIGIIPF